MGGRGKESGRYRRPLPPRGVVAAYAAKQLIVAANSLHEFLKVLSLEFVVLPVRWRPWFMGGFARTWISKK